MNLREAYSALGLPESSTKEEAKKSFKKLAAQHHPDKPGGDADKFKKINEAYQVIEKGKDFGPTPQQPTYHNNQGINIEDLFRGNGSPFGQQRKRKNIQAEDRQLEVDLSFKESVLGCHKELKYTRRIKCEPCDGEGQAPLNNGCAACGGSGVVVQRHGNMIMQSTCSQCRGKKEFESCKQCNEAGYIDTETSITVNVPGGVKNGNILRLQGIGDYAGSFLGGDQYASMLLKLSIQQINNLSIENQDVITNCSLSLLEAIQGCNKNISTIDGDIEITIAPRSRHLEEIVLPNLGVERKGNERVILNVNYPDNTDSLIQHLKE